MIFKEAIKSFLSGKTRTTLTIISIAIGVISVIVVNSISETGKLLVNAELDNIGLNGLILTSENKYSMLTQKDIEKISEIDGVSNTSPLLIKAGSYYLFNKEVDGFFYGMAESGKQLFNLETVYGRGFSKNELKIGGKVCQIDVELARSHFGRENVSGKKIKLLKGGIYEEYEIIGTVKKESMMLENMFGEYIPSLIYIPLVELADYSYGFTELAVSINPDSNYDEVSKEIISAVKAGKANTFSVKPNDLTNQRNQLSGMLDIVTIVLTVIGGISLVVSGLGIMTIMIISVNERKNEIGIKKAIGATNGRVMISFILESGIVAIIGSIVGSIVSIALLTITSAIGNINIEINYSMVVIAIVLSTAIGMVFGAYPAYKAAKLKPIDALQRE